MRSTSMWLSCAAHVGLGAGSALWLALLGRPVFSLPEAEWLEPALSNDVSTQHSVRCWLGLAAALVTAAITVRATRALVRRFEWAMTLHLTLRGSLLGARSGQLMLLAATSACGEELFFRALLGPAIGFVPSAALFGALHGLWRQAPIAVAAWSFGMGLVFGELYLASGTLLAPILAHCVINYENMQYICNYDPTPLDMDRISVSRESESKG